MRPDDPILASGPLPKSAIQKLCGEGFSTVGYLYPRGFQNRSSSCQWNGRPNTTNYVAMPYLGMRSVKATLQLIHDHIEGTDHRPTLVHCYNGWHASGWLSALALRQFCGLSGHDAWNYWISTAAWGAGHASEQRICKSLHSFSPDPTLKISEANRQILCAGYTPSAAEMADDCTKSPFPDKPKPHARASI